MSAADPVIPPTPPNRASEGGAVIPITARRPRRHAADIRGGPETPPTRSVRPGQPAPSSADREEPARSLAEHLEKTFNAAAGRTLSDDETAYVYRHTLGLVQHTLKGAAVNGIITDQQRDDLAELFAGMAEAPRYV